MKTRNQELYDKFQLYYDNVSSNQAPGFTLHEISVYLSDAQLELVRSFYEMYEKDEACRKALVPLVISELIEETTTNIEKIADESRFYELPVIDKEVTGVDSDGRIETKPLPAALPKILYVLYEAVRNKNGKRPCHGWWNCPIKPVTHDEFHSIYRDPFIYNKRRSLRLDVSDGKKSYAEVISTREGHDWGYYVRYVMRPTPIILCDGGPADFTIDGYCFEHEPVLEQMFDNAIALGAAQKAYQHYKS